MNLVNSNSYLKCETLVQADTVCMVNLSLETWTEISMEEMFIEWQTIKKNSKCNDYVERHFGGPV